LWDWEFVERERERERDLEKFLKVVEFWIQQWKKIWKGREKRKKSTEWGVVVLYEFSRCGSMSLRLSSLGLLNEGGSKYDKPNVQIERNTTNCHAKNWCSGNCLSDANDQITPPHAGPTALKKLQKLWLSPVTAPMCSGEAELLTNINTPVNVVQADTLRAAMHKSRRLHCSTGTVGMRELIGKTTHRGMVDRIPNLKHRSGPSRRHTSGYNRRVYRHNTTPPSPSINPNAEELNPKPPTDLDAAPNIGNSSSANQQHHCSICLSTGFYTLYLQPTYTNHDGSWPVPKVSKHSKVREEPRPQSWKTLNSFILHSTD
jgi:hypothetical protein